MWWGLRGVALVVAVLRWRPWWCLRRPRWIRRYVLLGTLLFGACGLLGRQSLGLRVRLVVVVLLALVLVVYLPVFGLAFWLAQLCSGGWVCVAVLICVVSLVGWVVACFGFVLSALVFGGDCLL